jgi:hypothetical protein
MRLPAAATIAWFVAGIAAAFGALRGFALWQIESEMQWPSSKSDRVVGPIAISPEWSVVLEERPMHPFLAEYEYRLRLYASDRRDGAYRGMVELLPNTGGRTYLCLYALLAPGSPPLLQVDGRDESSFVDLGAARRTDEPPPGYRARFVGAFVEEAYPLRFIPAAIQPACPTSR